MVSPKSLDWGVSHANVRKMKVYWYHTVKVAVIRDHRQEDRHSSPVGGETAAMVMVLPGAWNAKSVSVMHLELIIPSNHMPL